MTDKKLNHNSVWLTPTCFTLGAHFQQLKKQTSENRPAKAIILIKLNSWLN